MAKYICLNCGYILDLDKGLPERQAAPNLNALKQSGCGWHKNLEGRPQVLGIVPGTKWQDVPDVFACPSCSSEKGEFEEMG